LIKEEPSKQEGLLHEADAYVLFNWVTDHARKLSTPQSGAGNDSYEMILRKFTAFQLLEKEKCFVVQSLEENEFDGVSNELTMDSFYPG
jgi:hypothetical protein